MAAHGRRAVAPDEALARFETFVAAHFAGELAVGDAIVLAGHNVGFDVGFLKRLCRLARVPWPGTFSH